MVLLALPKMGDRIVTTSSGVEWFDSVLQIRLSEFSVMDSRFCPSGVRE